MLSSGHKKYVTRENCYDFRITNGVLVLRGEPGQDEDLGVRFPPGRVGERGEESSDGGVAEALGVGLERGVLAGREPHGERDRAGVARGLRGPAGAAFGWGHGGQHFFGQGETITSKDPRTL